MSPFLLMSLQFIFKTPKKASYMIEISNDSIQVAVCTKGVEVLRSFAFQIQSFTVYSESITSCLMKISFAQTILSLSTVMPTDSKLQYFGDQS